MKAGPQAVLTVLVVLSAAPALLPLRAQTPGHTAPVGAAADPWVISGTLVSSTTGAPLDRAEVTLSTSGETGSEVGAIITGETGVFRFTGLAPGKYLLEASQRGYIGSGYMEHEKFFSAIVTGPGLDTENLRFELQPKGVIDGIVRDDSGEAVQRAVIRLWRRTHAPGEDRCVRAATTMSDDQGSYEFNNLTPGIYYVQVTAKPWYARYASPRQASRENLTGDESPVSSPLDVAYPVTFYASATDSDAATPIPLQAGDHFQADFSLHAVPAMHLRVVLGPLPHASDPHPIYSPMLEQQSFGVSEFTGTGQSIQYASGGSLVMLIDGLPPGRYTLRRSGPHGPEGTAVGLSLTGDQSLDLGSSAPASVTVSGRLAMASGSKLPDHTTVRLESGGGSPSGDEAVVGPDGTFSLEGVAPGRYRIRARARGVVLSVVQSASSGAEAKADSLVVGNDSVLLAVTLVSGSATIEGFAEKGGKGFGGAMILLVPQGARDDSELYRRDQSDSDGSFSLAGVVPGNYTLVAIENGWGLDWARPEVVAPWLARGVRLRIEEGQRTVRLAQRLIVQAQ